MTCLDVWKAGAYFAVIVAVGAVLWSSSAGAQGCGYIACEQHIADEGPTPNAFHGIAGAHRCIAPGTSPCTTGTIPAGSTAAAEFYYEQFGSTQHVCEGGYATCNCGAKPNLPSGMFQTRTNGKICSGGCLYKANEPTVGVGDAAGVTWTTSGSGWSSDGGAECNNLDNDDGEGSDAPDPVECDGDVCVPLQEDQPEFCIEVGGEQICTNADDGPCSGDNAKGYLCMGNPPPAPPPPPATKPDPTNPTEPAPPSAGGGPITQCTGAGSCSINNWEYTEGGGDDPPGGETCPGGGTPPCEDEDDDDDDDDNSGGVQTCPDGSRPVGNQCPAPVTCLGGVAPVNGRCPAMIECPTGTHHGQIIGQCEPNEGGGPNVPGTVTCPGGITPVGTTCPGRPTTCPNGSQPVNGMCNNAQACDPDTDPDHCEPGDGNASGGETCRAAPACSGDAILCSVLAQQWRTRCAVERLVPEGSPTEADYGPANDGTSVWGSPGAGTGLDSSGWLGGGGGDCPDMGAVSFMGNAWNINDWLPCNVLKILAALILAAGFVHGAYIVGRG